MLEELLYIFIKCFQLSQQQQLLPQATTTMLDIFTYTCTYVCMYGYLNTKLMVKVVRIHAIIAADSGVEISSWWAASVAVAMGWTRTHTQIMHVLYMYLCMCVVRHSVGRRIFSLIFYIYAWHKKFM